MAPIRLGTDIHWLVQREMKWLPQESYLGPIASRHGLVDCSKCSLTTLKNQIFKRTYRIATLCQVISVVITYRVGGFVMQFGWVNRIFKYALC